MSFGVSTACLYPQNTEDALEELGKLGVKTCEIFLNSPSETSPEFARILREIAEKYGMHIVSVHPFSSFSETYMLFGEYKRRYLDALDFYKRCFDFTASLGAGISVIHGSLLPGKITGLEYIERFSELVKAGKEFGVTVPQENIFLAPIEDTKPLNAFLHDVARRDVPPKAIINFVRGWDYTMLQALHSAGLRVPEDVYLTGLDDDNTLPNFGYSMQYLPSTIDFSEAAAKLLIERVEAGNALPEPERRIFTTHMKPVFERKVTLPKPDAAPTETDEREVKYIKAK